MELRHLRYFVGVAEALNLTRAAKILRVAQPALSRQIRQLEEELGVKLLERNHTGVRLTASGKAFLAEARSLLAQSEQAVQVARRSGGPGSGELNLAYVWGLFHALVPPLLERFRTVSPETAIHLFDLSPLEQVKALEEHRVDAGFIGFPEEAASARLSVRKVGTCSFVAAVPKGHPAARARMIALGTLAHDFFLGISGQTYPAAARQVLNACARAGFRPRVLQMVERGYTILGMVAGNCGVALVPETLTALPHEGVVFRPLEEPPVADLVVAWKGKTPSPIVSGFLSVLGPPS